MYAVAEMARLSGDDIKRLVALFTDEVGHGIFDRRATVAFVSGGTTGTPPLQQSFQDQFGIDEDAVADIQQIAFDNEDWADTARKTIAKHLSVEQVRALFARVDRATGNHACCWVTSSVQLICC